MIGIVLGVVRVLVGAVLLVAFVGQRRASMPQRLRAVAGYQLVPPATQPVVVGALAAAEILLGGGLVAGVYPRATDLAAAAFLLVLAAAMAQALRRGIVTECGCFGTLPSSLVGWRLVVRNAVLAGLLAADAAVGSRVLAPDRPERELAFLVMPLCVLALASLVWDTALARRSLAGREAVAGGTATGAGAGEAAAQ